MIQRGNGSDSSCLMCSNATATSVSTDKGKCPHPHEVNYQYQPFHEDPSLDMFNGSTELSKGVLFKPNSFDRECRRGCPTMAASHDEWNLRSQSYSVRD